MILPLEENHLHWSLNLAIRVKGSLSEGDSAEKKHMFSGRWMVVLPLPWASNNSNNC